MEQQFDTVIMSNVIEHIEDDLGFLLSLKSLLALNGNIILTFPTELDRDDNALHFRTYNLDGFAHGIRDKLEAEIIQKRYLPPSFFTNFWRNLILFVGQGFRRSNEQGPEAIPEGQSVQGDGLITNIYFRLLVPFMLLMSNFDKLLCRIVKSQQGLIIFKFKQTS